LVDPFIPHKPEFNSTVQIMAEISKNHIHPERGAADRDFLNQYWESDMVYFDKDTWNALIVDKGGIKSFTPAYN
jgi:hypothetical protein